jgi:hypothetical protein
MLVARIAGKGRLSRPKHRNRRGRHGGPTADSEVHDLQDKSISIRGVFDDRKSRLAPLVLALNILGTTNDLVRLAIAPSSGCPRGD